MMEAQILRELETAAQILLANPNLVTVEQRQTAEYVFLSFKKTSSPYSLCMKILETTKVDYVLFEVAGLLKDALIREWIFLQEKDIVSLRQYLWQYVIDRPTLPPFVREKILQVIAIMVKRVSIDDFGCHRELLLNEIEKLIMNGSHAHKLLGCSLLSALLQEYSVTVKSSDIGLSLEAHFKAKHCFGVKSLKNIFQFCCKALSSLGNTEPPFSNEAQSLIKHLLSISETVLSWDFVSTSLLTRYRNEIEIIKENFSFAPNPSWKDVILDPQVLNLFFMVYWKIRLSPQLSHHALTCLVQLATVNGPVFSDSEELQYLENYVRAFLKLITSIEVLDREAWGISNMVKKTFVRAYKLPKFEMKLYEEFLDQVILLTCIFAEGASNEETINAEDRLYMEAFDHMMELWVNALYESYIFSHESSRQLSNEYYKQAFRKIFDVYLKCHLSPPEGTRGQGRDLELNELDESDETDRDKFQTQLQTIGNFGKNVPEHCLPLLSRLLEDRTKTLKNYLDKLFHEGPTLLNSSALVSLFEDMHWLLLISGNVLCVISCGLRVIPSKLMKYSMSQSARVDIKLGLQVFGSPDRDFSEFENAEEKTDLIIRLVSAIFRLSLVFKKFTENKLTQFLSPEVVSSLLWFFENWSYTYLLFEELPYKEISMPLVCAFGRDTEGGAWAVNYLLEQVVTYCIHFSSEPGVTQDALKLFISLVENKEKSTYFLKSEILPSIVTVQRRLPEAVKKNVYSGLTMAAVACTDEASRNEYWQKILQPLQERLKLIATNENFNKIYQEEHIRTEVLEVLDCFQGTVLGVHCPLTAEGVNQYLSPVFPLLPTLVNVYSNYQQIVEMVLGLLNECAKKLIIFEKHADSKLIYESCIHSIQTYAKCNVGRFSLNSETEEETFNDISLILQLLTNLLPKDYFDFTNLESSPDPEQLMMPADVCLYGLNLIIPLMSDNLFEHPSLCVLYFQFLVNLSEMYPEKICQVPDDLLKKILTSVEVGLTTFGQEIIPLCCEFLQYLAAHIFTTMDSSNLPGRNALRPFLKILIDLTLSHQITTSCIHTAGSALFALICCYQGEYHSLVQSLVAAQPNPIVGERLANAFTSLTINVPLTYGKKNQHLFMSEFDNFIAKTHGFLHVK